MKLKNDFQTLAAAFTLGALSIGFTPVAAAVSTYDANASLTLTLTDVTDLTNTQQTGFWNVTALGSGDVFLSEIGVATATGSVSVVDPAVSLGIGSSITQSSSSSGSATNGFASTDALTDLAISIVSESDLILRFSFAYEVMVDAASVADANGTANASASVDMLDDLGMFDVQAFADALSNPGGIDTGNGLVSLSGKIDLIIDPFSSNTISGFIDTFGSATAVPVPAAVWLFGTGLLGLIAVARRRQA
jgi:hypothetical protein